MLIHLYSLAFCVWVIKYMVDIVLSQVAAFKIYHLFSAAIHAVLVCLCIKHPYQINLLLSILLFY